MATYLNEVLIADPYEITVDSEVLGSTKRAANGTILTDYITTIMQKKITMNWRLISSADRDEIVSGCENAIGTARTLVLPDSRSISVYFPADAAIVETEVRTPGGWLYNIQATFMENLRTS